MKRLVSLADIFKDTAFTGLAATSKMIKENPQTVKKMVRAIVRSVIHTRDNPEDALQVSMKRLGLERDAAQDAYQMIRQGSGAGADRKRRGVDGPVASHCVKYKAETKTQ